MVILLQVWGVFDTCIFWPSLEGQARFWGNAILGLGFRVDGVVIVRCVPDLQLAGTGGIDADNTLGFSVSMFFSIPAFPSKQVVHKLHGPCIDPSFHLIFQALFHMTFHYGGGKRP